MTAPPKSPLQLYWDSLSPARFANMILRRVGIDSLDVVRSREEIAALSITAAPAEPSDVTVTYSAKRRS